MTTTILHIASSPMAENSVTRQLSTKLLAELKAQHQGARTITRDLAINPLPHVTGEIVGAYYSPLEQQQTVYKDILRASNEAIDELLSADIIVIDAPMWNFGIPSSLKAWIDHIVRVGKTFHYTQSGPEGLIPAGKKVIIVSARGGVYSSGPAQPMDHQEPYLKTVLGFMGLRDVSFVRAEGVAKGPEAKHAAIAGANISISEVLKKIA